MGLIVPTIFQFHQGLSPYDKEIKQFQVSTTFNSIKDYLVLDPTPLGWGKNSFNSIKDYLTRRVLHKYHTEGKSFNSIKDYLVVVKKISVPLP